MTGRNRVGQSAVELGVLADWMDAHGAELPVEVQRAVARVAMHLAELLVEAAGAELDLDLDEFAGAGVPADIPVEVSIDTIQPDGTPSVCLVRLAVPPGGSARCDTDLQLGEVGRIVGVSARTGRLGAWGSEPAGGGV